MTRLPGSSPVPTALAYADRAARTPIATIAAELNSGIGTTLVAYITGIKSRQLPRKWATDVAPRDEQRRVLISTYRVWLMVSESDGPAVARNWFIGANPWLGDVAPATRLRDGDVAKVVAAATAFVTDQGGA